MLSWLMNPWMLGLGGLAIASPILIHLLNKRRFKIVNWAAMDFLFQADKKNRRRVQLENFILLMLRCLAMLLIGLLLARPFLPSKVTSALNQVQQIERVFMIDDSLSQKVLNGTQPSIELVRESVNSALKKFADDDETEDWLTVMLTSQPDQPLLANEPLTRNTLASLTQIIDDIECTDSGADYVTSLGELRRYISGQRENVSRAAYVYSDMRARDWADQAKVDAESAPNKIIQDIAESTAGCFVIDVGGDADQNLAITSVRPEGIQVADKVIRFNVTVQNFGSQTVSDVRVLLQVNAETPQYETIASIAPGQSEQVGFRYMFNEQVPDNSLGLQANDVKQVIQNHRVYAEIDRQSLDEEALAGDQLIDDSSGYYASRVLNGVSVLLVDGDPMSVSERSETHYLRSLQVLGTGLKMASVTASQLEQESLSKYSVIFLCNVDEASPDRIKSLTSWVKDGGGLVMMPGNKVRASFFNEAFYQDGKGLSPIGLKQISGDPTMAKWVNFEVDSLIHPSLRIIIGSDETSLSKVDVFSWWTSEFKSEQLGKQFQVPIRLSDSENSPAMVDKSVGKGNVVVFTIPGDGDWTMWPSSPTFAPVMIDLIDYLVGGATDGSEIEIGGTITYPVDLTAFATRVWLKDSKNEKIETVAKPVDDSEEARASELYRAQFDDLPSRGFYEMGLTRHSGETESVLFASNIDPQEGQLKRLPESIIDNGFFGNKVSFVTPTELDSESVEGGNTEIWPQILLLLFAILLVEQFLGWWFGRKR